METNYYMVRAMTSSEQDFKAFFDNSVVAVGWSEIDFSQYAFDKSEELAEAVEKLYYNSDNAFAPTVSKKLNEVRRFHNIQKGDFIVIPFYNAIRLAVADDKILYDESAYDLDLSNQRKVQYVRSGDNFKTIPRDVLSEALQRRLRVRGSTVSDLYEFKDEIEKLFSKDAYTWTSDFEEKETKLKDSFKEKLIGKIKSGKTNLKTGGIGFEHLVQELLQCEGYKAEVLAKTAFQFGDADVYAVKSDKFQETKILIQVKHHNGYTDDWGLQQLDEVKKNSEHNDHRYVLITSAAISDSVRNIADEKGIIAIDGNELSDWILENLSKLSAETKIKLGISAVPQFSD
ncbi:MAG: restriction endonuclease [Bacteroidetes bacterium]|nr:restriction endonuclease [Bacteroidota bacterium]